MLVILLVQVGSFVFLRQAQSHIKELLTNHVTDTNKKIEKLEQDMKEGQRDMKEGHSRLEAKMDKILEKQS